MFAVRAKRKIDYINLLLFVYIVVWWTIQEVMAIMLINQAKHNWNIDTLDFRVYIKITVIKKTEKAVEVVLLHNL